jgi:hypothetical protein
MANRRQRLKEAGCCSQCTDPPIEGRSRCQKHLDKANALAKKRNAERKAHGMCLRCPNVATEGHVLCEKCLKGLRGRDVDWSDKHKRENAKYKDRLAAGLCKWCDSPRYENRALCKAHLEVERQKVRQYRAERKAQGLCWRCDDPVRPGGVLCAKHRVEVTTKDRARAQRKKDVTTPAPVLVLVEALKDKLADSTVREIRSARIATLIEAIEFTPPGRLVACR